MNRNRFLTKKTAQTVSLNKLFSIIFVVSDQKFGRLSGRFFGLRPLCVHLYYLLDVLDLVHELHLCHPPDVLELPDRPDRPNHTQQKQKQQ